MAPDTLSTPALLDTLATDFTHAANDLVAIHADLKRLQSLGDLPITLEDEHLRVRFPGCDADTVERLCEETGVHRGVVHEDPDFDAFAGVEMALLFPFAPSTAPSITSCVRPPGGPLRDEVEWRGMLTPEQTMSVVTYMDDGFEEVVLQSAADIESPWLSSSDYSSLHAGSDECIFKQPTAPSEGAEAIYRFIDECDLARR
jgi:hypothetical protein